MKKFKKSRRHANLHLEIPDGSNILRLDFAAARKRGSVLLNHAMGPTQQFRLQFSDGEQVTATTRYPALAPCIGAIALRIRSNAPLHPQEFRSSVFCSARDSFDLEDGQKRALKRLFDANPSAFGRALRTKIWREWRAALSKVQSLAAKPTGGSQQSGFWLRPSFLQTQESHRAEVVGPAPGETE